MAPRLNARPHHAPPALLTGASTPRHPHQLDVLLVASLRMVHDEPELPVLVLRCPRHDVLGCQAANVLKSILVQFFMLADIDRISAIVKCITIATAVHFLSALIISRASESVAKNRVVNRDVWVQSKNLLGRLLLFGEEDLNGITLLLNCSQNCLLRIIHRLRTPRRCVGTNCAKSCCVGKARDV